MAGNESFKTFLAVKFADMYHAIIAEFDLLAQDPPGIFTRIESGDGVSPLRPSDAFDIPGYNVGPANSADLADRFLTSLKSGPPVSAPFLAVRDVPEPKQTKKSRPKIRFSDDPVEDDRSGPPTPSTPEKDPLPPSASPIAWLDAPNDVELGPSPSPSCLSFVDSDSIVDTTQHFDRKENVSQTVVASVVVENDLADITEASNSQRESYDAFRVQAVLSGRSSDRDVFLPSSAQSSQKDYPRASRELTSDITGHVAPPPIQGEPSKGKDNKKTWNRQRSDEAGAGKSLFKSALKSATLVTNGGLSLGGGSASGSGVRRSANELRTSVRSQQSRTSGRSKKSGISEIYGYEVLDFWKANQKSTRSVRRRKTPPMMGMSQMSKLCLFEFDDQDETGDEEENARPLTRAARLEERIKRFVLHPSSRKRFVWDVLELMLIGNDLVFIPLLLFDPPHNLFFEVIGWFARLFWTMDVGVSFLTGFSDEKGVVDMRPTKIARRYMRTWLTLDVVIVFFNWLEIAFDSWSVGQSHRSLRFLRIMRLFRILKASEVAKMVSEHFRDDHMRAAFGIFRILVSIILTCHLFSCFWYGLSKINERRNWVIIERLEHHSVLDKYLWSFHWSVSQFTGPDTQVAPQNTFERIFAVIVVLSAYVFSACFISSITTSMTRLELVAETQQVHFVALRRYLHLNRISGKLGARVQRNAAFALRERSMNISEEEVELLQLVSEPLRVELHFEIFGPILKQHPLLRKYSDVSPAAFRKLCHTSVKIKNFHARDIIFSDDEIPETPAIQFLTHGKVHYMRIGFPVTEVAPVRWFCEACLWTQWSHVGTLRSLTDSRMMSIDTYSFQLITDQFRLRDFKPEAYAEKFVEQCNWLSTYGEGDLTDLLRDELEWEELLVAAFPKDEEVLNRHRERETLREMQNTMKNDHSTVTEAPHQDGVSSISLSDHGSSSRRGSQRSAVSVSSEGDYSISLVPRGFGNITVTPSM